MEESLILLAAADSIGTRLGVSAVATVVGVILIVVGRNNIESKTAEESGSRRTVNKALGRSNTYKGSSAAL